MLKIVQITIYSLIIIYCEGLCLISYFVASAIL